MKLLRNLIDEHNYYLFAFTIAMLSANCSVKSQSVFKKDYDYGIVPNFNCHETNVDRYIVGIGSYSKIDNLGNILVLKKLVYPPVSVLGSLAKTKSNYVLDGMIEDSSCFNKMNMILFLTKIDTNLKIVKSMGYKLNGNCLNHPFNLSSNSDNGAISVGRGETTCYGCWDKFYAMRVDSNLHPVWAKYYTSHYGGAQFGKQTPDGGFLLGFNLRNDGAVVAKTDSMGNTIWCKSYIRPKGFIHDCVIEPDGSSIITGYTDSVNIPPTGTYPPGFAPKLFMMKLDTSGSVLWAKAFDSDKHWLMASSRIVKTKDDGYAILSSVASYISIKPILIKTDSNGDTLWTRLQGRGTFYYQAISLLNTSDNGFLMGGDAIGSFPNAPYGAYWLYKTDSLGHATGCHEFYQPTYTYNIFPVDSDVVLSSIDGAIEVPIAIKDTAYMPPYWDDCIINSTPPQEIFQKYEIHPNPSKGIIHIYRDNSYLSDCYYSVYDSTGRLLIQKSFTNGNKDELVDLSKFGKGIYLIKILDGIEMLTKKIVIE